MKKLMTTFLLLASFESFAFSTVQVRTELKLVRSEFSKKLRATLNGGSNDYCEVRLSSDENVESLVVPKGSVFEVTEVIQNRCAQDWGRQCRLDLSARSQDLNVNLSLVCKSRGIFARELTSGKVNKVMKNQIDLK